MSKRLLVGCLATLASTSAWAFVAAQGFRYGFVFGEHIVAEHLYVHNCEMAVVFHDSTHLSKIGMLVAQHNRTILATSQGAMVWS